VLIFEGGLCDHNNNKSRTASRSPAGFAVRHCGRFYERKSAQTLRELSPWLKRIFTRPVSVLIMFFGAPATPERAPSDMQSVVQ
jgi:hypothetical protein